MYIEYVVLSVTILLGTWLWLGSTWLMYLAAVGLGGKKVSDVPFILKPFVLLLTVVGTGFNWTWNIVFGTIIFLDLPKELYFSARMGRLKNYGSGWRKNLAIWFCSKVLDPFDNNHCNKVIGLP